MTQQKIYLIGAGMRGWEGFGAKALEVIDKADILIGKQRHLDIFSSFSGEKILLDDPAGILEILKNSDKVIVVLSSGDPTFFGIARFLLRNFTKERIEIFPNVTSMQYAFARIKEPWDDAIFVSLHGRGMVSAIDKIIAAEKACVLTDPLNTPVRLATEMLERGAEGYEAWLCEDLGMPTEKFTRTTVRGLMHLTASELNLVILIRTYEPVLVQYPLLGIDDREFNGPKKLVTSKEERAIALALLELQDDLVLWDIGAGSCALSIEASNLMPNGRIYAVEKNAQFMELSTNNVKKFGARNIRVVEADAPDGLEDLPEPDRVFIGGAGGRLEEIIEAADRRLKPEGIILISALALDTLTTAVECLENDGYLVEATCVNLATTSSHSDYKMFEARNPVYLVSGRKPTA